MNLGIKLPEWIESIRNLPQTQKDITTIAKATKQVQSPQMQQQLMQVRQDVTDLGKTLLVLQALGTAAAVGIFLIHLRKEIGR